MATICQQCGDKGFYEALIDCEKCKSTSVHIYCLPVLPASWEDDVIWYCEGCEPKVVKASTVDKSSSFLLRKCDSENRRNDLALQFNSRLKKDVINEPGKSKKNKNVDCSLAETEVHKSESGPSPHLQVHHSKHPGKDQICRRLGELNGVSFREEAESLQTKRSLIASGDYKSKPQCSSELHCESKKNYEKLGRCRLDGSSSCENAESVKTRTPVVVTNDPAKSIRECSSNAQEEPVIEVPCGRNKKKDCQFRRPRELARNRSDAETESLTNSQVNTSSNVSEKSITEVQRNETSEKDLRLIKWRGLDEGSNKEDESWENEMSLIVYNKPSDVPDYCFVPAQPIIEPIWKGNLCLSNVKNGNIEGLVAHLSTSACSKVCQEAKLLPQFLCPELLPRSNAWPKSFNKWGPSDDSIALYLFPNNERAEKVYDGLVDDMISHDFALKAAVKNAELLLFTSNLLPFQFWRFRSKFYLWGVFRAKQASQDQALAVYSVNAISVIEAKNLQNSLTLNPRSPASPLSLSNG